MAVKTVQAIINGVTTTLTLDSTTGKYEATITAPGNSSYNNNAGHYFPVTIKVTDDVGNAATQKSVNFKVDTVAPTLSVTAPTNNLHTNKASCTVTGTTNDATSSPVSVTVKLNSGTAKAVTVGTDGAFSKALTLAAGTNTITITAKDAAGKTTTVTRTVVLDTGVPVIHSVTINPNPVDAGKTYVISVEVTD